MTSKLSKEKFKISIWLLASDNEMQALDNDL